MKLLQLNVWMGRLTRQILPLIEREQPDIITSQEVFSASKNVPFPDTTFNIFELMKESGAYQHTYFSPICSFNYSGVKVDVGNSIHSKFPILTERTVFTNGSYQASADVSIYESNVRNAQLVTLELPNGKTINIGNHHGYWEPNPIGSEKTVAAMQVMAAAVRECNGPIIVAGDLNVDPGTPAMHVFEGWLEDLTGTHNVTNTLSTLGKLQGVAPDHILISDEVHVTSFKVLDDIVSDHQALLLDFEL